METKRNRTIWKVLGIILLAGLSLELSGCGLKKATGGGGNGSGGGGGGSGASSSISSSINPNNIAPTAYSLGASCAQDSSVDIQLSAKDPENSSLTYVIVGNPSNGAIQGSAPNLTYSPNSGFTGSDIFTYRVVDTDGGISPLATVRILVGGSAIFIVSNPSSVNATDQIVRNRLIAKGFQVQTLADTVAGAAHASGKDLIVISSSAGSTNVNTKFRDVAVAVLTWERFLYDDMQMTGAGATDNGVVDNQTSIDIADPTHPLAAGLSGTINVFSTAGSIVWGTLNNNADIVATVSGDSTKPVLFVYETGDLMAGGLIAPARRVGYFLPDNSGAALTTDGLTLLDAAINSALTQ